MHRLNSLAIIALAAFAQSACSEDVQAPAEPTEAAFTVNFAGTVGDLNFACGQSYTGIGTSGSELTPHDFKLYIHDVRLIKADGEEIPLALDQDNPFQHEDLVLLDFEDASGPCANGTTQTNAAATGTAPAGQYTGVAFTFGVPFELNHADAALAATPLNLTTMFWGWQSGYKFLRVEGTSTGLPDGIRIHMGSAGCEMGDDGAVSQCANPNRSEILIEGFDPSADTIAVDLAALLATSNIDENAENTPGLCMASPTDADCAPIFEALGIGSGSQSFFHP
jgi:uncharacterized repeat protein (TIGR04052 family)